MTDKVQKIREEVERLKSQLLRCACSSQIAMETYCKEEAYNEVLSMLDTLQEEPVSDECIYNRTLEERQRSCKFCSAACQVRIKEEPVSIWHDGCEIPKSETSILMIRKEEKDSNYPPIAGCFHGLNSRIDGKNWGYYNGFCYNEIEAPYKWAYVDDFLALEEIPPKFPLISQKKCMFTKDSYTNEDRKVLCEDCKEKCEYCKEEPVAPKVLEDMLNAKTAAESLGISQEEHDRIVDELIYGKEPELVDIDDLPKVIATIKP